MIPFVELPYKSNALEPFISERTIDFHYGKHHKGYVDTLNTLIRGTAYETMSLEEIILNSRDKVFNNAAQVWNHNFFWRSLTPMTTEKISESFSSALDHAFGGVERFKEDFTETASMLFGSGYVWLVMNTNGMLYIKATKDADTPIVQKQMPLLTCDVWEHAYYLDYQNNRRSFVENFWKFVNWDFASRNFEKALEATTRMSTESLSSQQRR